MPQPVVCLALDRVAEDVVCFLDRRKLRPGAVVVVHVGVVYLDLLSVGLLDLVLGGVGGNLEKVVEVVGHVSVI
ncbi:hypothetical protein C446_15433 [Halobiforma nitratireducens JCM 10879]|uniref:Uncharacterized protein n=1 Tax=Halobiforma nitratireducens JCM 10879 TaxID=1227454 RepID=M0LCT2_9EURY|nr:hypothetical protein C446_15433 [Halobiforma nitratireducens JCM 10879]